MTGDERALARRTRSKCTIAFAKGLAAAMNPLTRERHRERHVALHRALDELFADYVRHHPEQREFLQMPLDTLLKWSYEQTIEPTEGE